MDDDIVKVDGKDKKFNYFKLGGLIIIFILFICLITFQNVWTPKGARLIGGGAVLAGVNPFDQDLNTWNSPNFDNLTANTLNGNLSCS